MFYRYLTAAYGILIMGACGQDPQLEPYRPGPARRHRNPRAAIKHCQSALDAVWSRPANEQFSEVFETCAEMYVEPLCHHRFRTLASVPAESRAVHLAESCKVAYCGQVPPPVPRLCESEPGALHEEALQEQWREFNWRVFRWDLGVEDPLEGSAFRYLEAASPDRVASSPTTEEPTPVQIILTPQESGYTLHAEGAGVPGRQSCWSPNFHPRTSKVF